MAQTTAELIELGQDPSKALTVPERERLDICEGIIKKGLNTFLEVGGALAEINDSRLYKETHDTFPQYCKDVWDLGKSRAYQQIDGYRTVRFLESKMSTIVDKIEAGPDAITDEKWENVEGCRTCEHRKTLANRAFKGVRIPGDIPGKCTRPEGLCENVAALEQSEAPQEIILPINEAQARQISKLKDPDDQVKAWGLVMAALAEKRQNDPNAKLTASMIGKVVKGVQGGVVKRTIDKTKLEVEQTSLVPRPFQNQYQVLLDIVVSLKNNNWKDGKKKEVVKYLQALLDIAQSED